MSGQKVGAKLEVGLKLGIGLNVENRHIRFVLTEPRLRVLGFSTEYLKVLGFNNILYFFFKAFI